MADNITAKANTGAGVEVLAADDVGGILYPRTKIVTGADGVAGGDVTPANPLPVVLSSEGAATFRGRSTTFRTPGRAGTAGQKIFTIINAAASTKIVHVNQITVDLYQTVVKAITVAPPIIRIHRFTVAPTGGSTLVAKTAKDTSLTSSATVTVRGDASADGTIAGSVLTVTIPADNCLTQEYAPRYVTAVGYEPFDRAVLLEDADIVLRAGEGLVVFLDYTLATQNPTTDMWLVGCDWYEV